MARDVSDATPISARSELIEWIAAGAKPKAEWRLGTEHEKIPFYRRDASPVPYGGAISLEPGGQFELSGAPLASIQESAAELDRHLAELKRIAEPLGIGFLTL